MTLYECNHFVFLNTILRLSFFPINAGDPNTSELNFLPEFERQTTAEIVTDVLRAFGHALSIVICEGVGRRCGQRLSLSKYLKNLS